jgi:antitoxin VapB
MKTAKLFKNGQSQAVRLPKEFRFTGSEVYVVRQGKSVVLIPKEEQWGEFLDSLSMFKFDGGLKREQPKGQQKRKALLS